MLDSDYLFMYFNRPEFDRYARFNSWGSARETFDWETLCNIDIELPNLSTQQKYVDTTIPWLPTSRHTSAAWEDLKLTCDGYIEELRRKMPCEKIGKYIELTELTNENSQYGIVMSWGFP